MSTIWFSTSWFFFSFFLDLMGFSLGNNIFFFVHNLQLFSLRSRFRPFQLICIVLIIIMQHSSFRCLRLRLACTFFYIFGVLLNLMVCWFFEDFVYPHVLMTWSVYMKNVHVSFIRPQICSTESKLFHFILLDLIFALHFFYFGAHHRRMGKLSTEWHRFFTIFWLYLE